MSRVKGYFEAEVMESLSPKGEERVLAVEGNKVI